MKGSSEGGYSPTHFGVSIFLLIVFQFASLPVDSSPMLTITESAHVWGGDISMGSGSYSGAGDIPLACSEHGYGLIYWEYAPAEGDQGLFLALVNNNAQMAVAPIRLTGSEYGHTNILWDGEAYLCLVGIDDGMQIKRISADGTILSENQLTISGASSDYFNAIIDNGVLRVIRRDDNYAEFNSYSLDGTALADPIRISLIGELKCAVFLDGAIATFAERESADYKYIQGYFEIFDMSGNTISPRTGITGLSWTPFRAIAGDGAKLICIGGKNRDEGGITMVSFAYDTEAQQVGAGVEIGYIPPEGYYGKINFMSELIPVESGYLAVWGPGRFIRIGGYLDEVTRH